MRPWRIHPQPDQDRGTHRLTTENKPPPAQRHFRADASRTVTYTTFLVELAKRAAWESARVLGSGPPWARWRRGGHRI